MKKPGHNILTYLVITITMTSAPCFAEDYWQQFVHYEIHAKLDTLNRLVDGLETLIYQNNSPDTLSELYFHLYPNAFQRGSIMEKEVAATSLTFIRSDEDLGWMTIDSLLIIKRNLLAQRIKIDTLTHDTILKISIDPHLLPDEELWIRIKFTTKIHKGNPLIDKGGYRGSQYEISQWYPKICVYDHNGWNALPFHWLGEFYGEFGTFDVTLDVPASYIIGATGEVVAGDPGWNLVKVDSIPPDHSSQIHSPQETTSRIVTFHAENIHDFAWLASPNFYYETGIYKNIPIHILYQKSSYKNWHNRALSDAKLSLAWLEELVGEYPYPVLSICQGVIRGGMEYPTLAILGEYDAILLQHEIAHAYFYGALANNEQTEGWLDEGLTTYQNELFINEHFPNYYNQAMEPSVSIHRLSSQFKPIRLIDLQLNSLYYYFYSGFDQPLKLPCYKVKDSFRYVYHVYQKPAKFIAALDNLVGRKTFIQILHAYYSRFKFKHVYGKNFQEVCEQISGLELDWFFKQWLDSVSRIDYAYDGKKSYQLADKTWKTNIAIKRLGNGISPVEIEAITCAGDSVRTRWDGKTRQTEISLQTKSKITQVYLDPDDLILDQNRLNNGSLRIKLFYYPEFPSMYYLPRNAYSLFLWPQPWYNDIDGLTLGVNVFGGYLNRYNVTRNSISYGIQSKKVHYKFGFSSPWERIDHNLWRHFSILNIEGRRELDANLSYRAYRALGIPSTDDVRLGFVHQKLIDERYGYRKIYDGDNTVEIQEWDSGNINKVYFNYSSNYSRWLQALSSLDFSGELSSRKWNSDFDFVRLALKYQLQFGQRTKTWWISFRNFLGYIYHNDSSVPIQSQFGIAEGNPNQRFKYYYLRSPGSMPSWLPYHLPGDGNLRGYYNKLIFGSFPLTANRLAIANLEFVQRNVHFLLPKVIKKQFSGINFCLFFDGGGFWDTRLKRNILFDAGFGFHFYRQILGRRRQLRIDFPIWLSHPNIDGQSPHEHPLKFRWIVSFQ